ncbi:MULTISPECIES: ABC transporter permease [Dethiosulfovibrio]|uniref:Iron ABC transporter permease n=2 Tax=Dethiosulfovibrio TaxID=47054 RepID=A0ABS9ER18_9BACT|nr:MULTISPECIES: iron ABC transporter permease [Dethiosulfovibrio]MCF4115164.1 iron ABC transporter permease [Dethiosulfovibrio russensis]MCF4143614.1 iron ABC transporter permease [Dethiosulfovibrio marinus]MCF4146031.1 iron ABC transporter permease [Dethiosulfovibrio acidaminovorans]
MRRGIRELRLLWRDPVVALLVLAVGVALALFVIYPLGMVLLKSFQGDGGGFSLENYLRFGQFAYLRNALKNSLQVGALTGITGVAVGYVAALTMVRTNIRWKKILHLIFILPIIAPPFTSALSVLMLFGSNGLITRGLLGIRHYSIYGFKGVLISQVFTFAPVAYLTLRGVLESLNPTLEDAAMNVGASRWQTFLRVTLPLSLPGIASAFLVVFIESLADFGNPLVLAGSRFPMLATQAYLEITGSFNLPLGAALAVVLLLPSVTAFLIQRYFLRKRQYTTVTGKPVNSTSKLVGPGAGVLLRGVLGLFALSVALFYGVIAVGAFTKVWGYDFTPTLDHLTYAFQVGGDTIKDTLIVALLSTPISGILGMLIAFMVVRLSFPGKGTLEFGSILNFAVPGTVVGIGYILAFNRPPMVLIGTLSILVLNFVFRYIPVGIQSGVAVLRQIDPSIEEASRNLGADGLTTFRKVTLPLIAPAFFSGLVFAFVRAMTAISAAIFLVSANWNLLTVQILSQVGSGRLGVAAAFSVILVCIVLIAVAVIGRLVPGRTGGASAIQVREG